jgi:hypothetical protein
MSAQHGFFHDVESALKCPTCSVPLFKPGVVFCHLCNRSLASMGHNLRESTRDKVVQDARVDSYPGVQEDAEDGTYSPNNTRNGFGVDDDEMVGDEPNSIQKSHTASKSDKKAKKLKEDSNPKMIPTNEYKRTPVWPNRKNGTVGMTPFMKFDGSEPLLDPERPENVKAIEDLGERFRFNDDFDPTIFYDEALDKKELVTKFIAYMKYLMARKGYKVGMKANGHIRGDGAAYKYPGCYMARLMQHDEFNTAHDFVEQRRESALRITRDYAEKTAPGTSYKKRLFENATEMQQEAHIVKLQGNEMHGFDDISKVFGERIAEWKGQLTSEGEEGGEEEGEEEGEEQGEEQGEEEDSASPCKKPRLGHNEYAGEE